MVVPPTTIALADAGTDNATSLIVVPSPAETVLSPGRTIPPEESAMTGTTCEPIFIDCTAAVGIGEPKTSNGASETVELPTTMAVGDTRSDKGPSLTVVASPDLMVRLSGNTIPSVESVMTAINEEPTGIVCAGVTACERGPD